MTVRALRGMKRMLREDPTVVVLVRTQEQRLALRALQAATADIAALGAESGGHGAPKFVHGPLTIPGGLLLMADLGDGMPLSERERLPGIVVRHLESAGVREASVGPAPSIGKRYERLNRFVPIARAWLRGAAPAGSPPVARRPWPGSRRPGCAPSAPAAGTSSAW